MLATLIPPGPWRSLALRICIVALYIGASCGRAFAQPSPTTTTEPVAASPKKAPEAPQKVEVVPEAQDTEIVRRLRDIYQATGWFTDVKVAVRDGVVFLEGRTKEDVYKTWAEQLRKNTQGVVAVVNRMQVTVPSPWDFNPAREEIDRLGRALVGSLPLILIALSVLGLSWVAAKITRPNVKKLLARRIASPLLREVAARASGILIFLLGLYLVLKISGLSRLAVTVIGGTGLVGLVLGIAFRDITENFLASMFLSLQNPFREGDLVEIAGTTGFVERLNSRTTVLITLDGTQSQIPNATVFKSVIRNYTSNPNRRDDFVVGIGYDDPIQRAQQLALDVLRNHPAVLDDPEPWVLVDRLGAATVDLRVYYWIDSSQYSYFKVRSAVIRLVKAVLQEAGIALPDSAREVIFPKGVPVTVVERGLEAPSQGDGKLQQAAEQLSTEAEGKLNSEASGIRRQGRRAWSPDQGENLLAASPGEDDNKSLS